GGRGGRSGTGSGGSGNASSGGTPEPAECSLMRDGATGDEPNGEIPVCCAPSVTESTAIEEVFNLLNAHRMDNGVDPLEYDTELEAAIQGHCLHMSQHTFFDHEADEEGVVLPWDRAKLCGTSANGENIAQGQRSPAAVMEAWTESQGHNENMLNPRFKRVGIGYVADGRYWGQIFGQ
ncbi:MAG: CAP domain-containing protein, partial [Myxococcota bacterium]|nr:CAP domain-containing protein [Myxococcota bacterium]